MVSFCVSTLPQTWTALHRASYNGCLDIVQTLVNDGVDVNSETDEGETPLLLAARKLYPDVVEFLISAGANINCCDENKWTVLHHASSEGWLSIAQSVVERGIDVNAKNKDGESALLLAAEYNCPDVAEFLLGAGANMNGCNRKEWTVLHYASLRLEEWIAIAQSLVKEGIDVNAKNEEGNTPLILAVEENNLDMVKLLISAGANLNCCKTEACFYFALNNGYTEIVKLVIDAGANVNSCNENKFTLLHAAAEDGYLEMTQFLVDKGADVNARSSDGSSPLQMACSPGEIFHLFKAGVDYNSPLAVLFFSEVDGFPESDLVKLVKLLIKRGAILKSKEYNLILKIPVWKKVILQDIELCSKVIINKFNNKDLPELYELVKSATNLPQIDRMKIIGGSKEAEDVMQTVKREIQASGHCNVLEARPIVLSMLAVKSFLDYCHDVKESEDALKLAQNSELQNVKRSALFDSENGQRQSKKICLN